MSCSIGKRVEETYILPTSMLGVNLLRLDYSLMSH